MTSIKYDNITVITHSSQEGVVFDTDLLYDVIRINSKFCNRKKRISQLLFDKILFHKLIERTINDILSGF
jgi:hypothetical protein